MDYLVQLYDAYNDLDKLSDDRTKGWAFVDSIFSVIAVLAIYNLIAQQGAEYMKSRPPYNVEGLNIIYNVFLICVNAYIIVETVVCAKALNYGIFCNGDTRNNTDPMEMRLAKVSWLFYITKYLELCDTGFYVLRKRTLSLKFIHLYHHSSIVLFIWIHVKWFPTGNSYLVMIVNSGVLVILYIYYILTLLDRKYLRLKKFITILQFIQFGFAFCFHFVSMKMNCTFYPKWYNIAEIIYIFTLVLALILYYVMAHYSDPIYKKEK